MKYNIACNAIKFKPIRGKKLKNDRGKRDSAVVELDSVGKKNSWVLFPRH
jgi:hypothetical protein